MRCVSHLSSSILESLLSAFLVDYLLRPRLDVTHNPRPSAAIVILLLYFLLLIPVAVSYFRLLQTVAVNSGYVPRGPQWYQAQDLEAKHRRRGKRRRSSAVSAEKPRQPWWNQDIERAQLSGLNYAHTIGVPGEGDTAALQHGLEQFCSRDVFVCEADGKPIFCSTCLNWKPDRAHHCREVGRCVRKMDHFCPW